MALVVRRKGRKRGRGGDAYVPRALPRQRRAFRGYGRRTSRSLNELKFHDLDVDDATIATTGTIAEDSCLTIAQGADESERVGRKIVVEQVFVQGRLTLNDPTSQATSADDVRVIVYVDHQANGATAAVTDILESASFLSFRNLANSKRFTFLMDETFTLVAKASGGGALWGRDFKHFCLYKKNLGIPIEYSGTTGAIAQMPGNNIGVLTIASCACSGMLSKFRIRYSD